MIATSSLCLLLQVFSSPTPTPAPSAAAPSPAASATPTPEKRSILDIFKKVKGPVQAALSEQDIVAGLKEALTIGATNSVKELGRADGFLANPRVKIPVPEKLQPVDSALRKLKQSKVADNFVTSLNRAAEKAVPAALSILGNAVKSMTIGDAKSILTGPKDAATQYFKKTTTPALTSAFRPLVEKATAETGVAAAYKSLLSRAGPLASLVGKDAQDLDGYVTQKALDGLFTLIADEEQKIRDNPAARVTDLLKKVFGH